MRTVGWIVGKEQRTQVSLLDNIARDLSKSIRINHKFPKTITISPLVYKCLLDELYPYSNTLKEKKQLYGMQVKMIEETGLKWIIT